MPTPISDINALEAYLGNVFKDNTEYNAHRIKAGAAEVGYYFLSSLTDRDYITSRIIYMAIDNAAKLPFFSGDFASVFAVSMLSGCTSLEEASAGILGGNTLVVVQNQGCYAALVVAGNTVGRSVSTPNTEGVLRGSYAAFNEDLRNNLSLIRQMLRTDKLKSEIIKLGTLSQTQVAICHIEGRAKPEVIEGIKSKLAAADITYVVDSAYIEIALEQKPSLFRTAGTTEKVDKVCAKLVSGRVAIIVDGSPFVLTLPYVFAENLQTTEDYIKSPIYATFIRIIRMLGLLITIYLPSVFLAAVSDSLRLLPLEMLLSISSARRNIAYSMFAEIFLMLVIFEIIREVGIRMPKNIGSAVGIVGSIILGDAAVQAGIASTTVIIVVALTAISNFVLPPFIDSPIVLRFAILIAAYFLSFFGIFIMTLILLTRLCAKESFGTPFMTPLSPFSMKGLSDFITVFPKKVLGRAEENIAGGKDDKQ